MGHLPSMPPGVKPTRSPSGGWWALAALALAVLLACALPLARDLVWSMRYGELRMTWSQIPTWARYTMALAMGVAAGIYAGTMAYADLRHTATDAARQSAANAGELQARRPEITRAARDAAIALDASREHEDRIRALETAGARRDEADRAIQAQLARILDRLEAIQSRLARGG